MKTTSLFITALVILAMQLLWQAVLVSTNTSHQAMATHAGSALSTLVD